MQRSLFLALFVLVFAEAPAAQRPAPPAQPPSTQPPTVRAPGAEAPGAQTPSRTVTRQPDAKPAPAPSDAEGQDDRAAQDKAKAEAARKEKLAADLAKLRASFGEEFYRLKSAAADELDAALVIAGRDAAASAAATTEVARKYRGELATLRTAYAEKARALGGTFTLPDDDAGLEQTAAAAAPANALRFQFQAQVAALARAAQKELAIAEESTRDDVAFAAKRTEIARRYRGQVVSLQQLFAQRAAEQGLTIDTSDVSKALGAIAAVEASAPAPREPKPAPAEPTAPPKTGADAGPAKPAPVPMDAEVLRGAFTKQVDALRTSLASELATADATLKGDELATKRASIVQKYRTDLASYRATVAARAQAAGVTLNLPTDQELVPELGPAPATPPKETPVEGQQPPTTDPPKSGDGAAPPKDAPKPGPGAKPGRGPRFGNGGGGKPGGSGGR